MKNLDLNAYGVEEMSQSQMQETRGGFFGLVFSIILCAAVYVLSLITGD